MLVQYFKLHGHDVEIHANVNKTTDRYGFLVFKDKEPVAASNGHDSVQGCANLACLSVPVPQEPKPVQKPSKKSKKKR